VGGGGLDWSFWTRQREDGGVFLMTLMMGGCMAFVSFSLALLWRVDWFCIFDIL